MNTVNFGKMLRKLRHQQGLTQLELANILNVTDKAVSKWENGSGYPEITQLPELSEVFGVSIDYMLRGRPKGIAIAGNILVDIINIIDKYPEKTMQASILKTVHAVGGCVPNTIINLAKIDPDLFLTALGKVGNDENGRYVVSTFRKHGVNVEKILVSETENTSSSIVMSEENTGERTFFYVRGANGEFGIKDIDFDALDCEIFHIGYILLLDELDEEDEEYGTKMARLLCEVSKRGIKTSIDVISSEVGDFAAKVIPALKYCDYTIMNEIESCSVSGLAPRNSDGSLNIANIKATMQQFIKYGVREKVIVHCREGGFIMTPDGSFTAVASLALPDGYIKGSVGAGDAFAAGCLYGIYNGFGDTEILEFAASAACCNLSTSDSISGMKNKNEVMKLKDLYPRGDLKGEY